MLKKTISAANRKKEKLKKQNWNYLTKKSQVVLISVADSADYKTDSR